MKWRKQTMRWLSLYFLLVQTVIYFYELNRPDEQNSAFSWLGASVPLILIGVQFYSKRTISKAFAFGFSIFQISEIIYLYIQISIGTPPSFLMVKSFHNQIFSSDGVRVLSENGMLVLFLVVAFYIGIVTSLSLRVAIESDNTNRVKSHWRLMSYASYVIFIAWYSSLSTIRQIDPVFEFLRGIWRVKVLEKSVTAKTIKWRTSNFREPKSPKSQDRTVAPDVIVVIAESYALAWAGKYKNGLEVTPFLNKQIRMNRCHTHFYANSTYTINGVCTVLSSCLPPLSGSIAEHFPNIKIPSLARELKRGGYHTEYIIAQDDESFSSTDKLAARLEFDWYGSAVRFTGRSCIWGWGVNDNELYKVVLERLLGASNSEPKFIAVSTVVNHTPYNYIPPNENYIFGRPKSIQERFANSVNYADRSLQDFVEKLTQRVGDRPVLVFVTADHAMPIDDADRLFNSGVAEEHFRIPFICISINSPDVRFSREIGSQQDIPVTILSALSMVPSTEMWGRSLIEKDSSMLARSSALIVQQGGPGYIVIVENNRKMVFNTQDWSERVYVVKAHDVYAEKQVTVERGDRDKLQDILSYVFSYNRELHSSKED